VGSRRADDVVERGERRAHINSEPNAPAVMSSKWLCSAWIRTAVDASTHDY
jgi:hypothetical protein